MDFKKESRGIDWSPVALDRNEWRAVLGTVIKRRVT
jgi:hypothetical protein